MFPSPDPSLTPRSIDPGVRIGHVHLKVADLDRALRFYCGVLGFELIQRFGTSAAFISAGGYHHHIGLNEWHTRGQPAPSTPAAGLGGIEILTPDLSSLRTHLSGREGVQDGGDALTLHDPWGNRVTVREVAQP